MGKAAHDDRSCSRARATLMIAGALAMLLVGCGAMLTRCDAKMLFNACDAADEAAVVKLVLLL